MGREMRKIGKRGGEKKGEMGGVKVRSGIIKYNAGKRVTIV